VPQQDTVAPIKKNWNWCLKVAARLIQIQTNACCAGRSRVCHYFVAAKTPVRCHFTVTVSEKFERL